MFPGPGGTPAARNSFDRNMYTDPVVRAALVTIAVACVFAMCYFAASVVAPMVLAVVIGIVLTPITDKLQKLGLPGGVGATLSLILILAFLGTIFFAAEPMVRKASDSIPELSREMNVMMADFRESLQGIEEASDQVNEALGQEKPPANEDGDGRAEGAQMMPSVEDAILLAPAFLSQALIFVGMLFFFSYTRRGVYAWSARRFSRNDPEVVERFFSAERTVARYFLAISIINSGYAVVMTLALMAIGMPSALLWGIAAGLLNYVLYLGPAVMFSAFLLGGIVTFDGTMSLAPAAIYAAVNLMESQFITPTLVGAALAISPLAIFVALVLFLWLWGPVGGIVAIPLMLFIAVLLGELHEHDMERAAREAEPAE